ncbi:acyl-CoA N-acyltransferase [Epithele typhae]|uniref:acyl-CoA N-acyltransferase n=1 Tax=Epithele typhae TaxID=378194 RepID=UPI00200891FC|nr:acyl-CoA N-acyltransferase [Epithele typhae]KAH9943238.1 acyl-CoA N-acyltransferase [Epithele typhae]
MATPQHEIIIVPAPGQPGFEELRQQCYDVRIEVFHREQGFPLETEVDEFDDAATHFLLRLTPSMQPIGTIRCVRGPHGAYYKLTRLAILHGFRKHRFGRALVLALHDYIRTDVRARAAAAAAPGPAGSPEPTSVTVVCSSQLPAKGFYAKFGYVAEGDEYDDEGEPHQKMVARLSLSD